MRWAFVIGMHLFSAGIHVRGRKVSVSGVLAHRIKCVTEPGRATHGATSREARRPSRPARISSRSRALGFHRHALYAWVPPSPRVRCLDSADRRYFYLADHPPRHLSIKPTGQTARAHSSSLSERVSATLAHYAQANSGPLALRSANPIQSHSTRAAACCTSTCNSMYFVTRPASE